MKIIILILLLTSQAIAGPCKEWNFESDIPGTPPAKWKSRGGAAASTYRIYEEENGRYLKAHSSDTGVQLGFEIDSKSDANYTLSWRWRVHVLPEKANETKIESMDSAAAVYAVFGGRLSQKIIKYVWSSTLKTGTVLEHPRNGSMRIMVVASGEGDIGRWQSVKRNLREDYHKYFGSKLKNLAAIGVKTDSDSTSSIAHADYDDFLLCEN